MSQTITVRLTSELSSWLEETSKRTGLPRGRIIRENLEKALQEQPVVPKFQKLIGCVEGPQTLSQRKGYSRT